MSRNKIETNDVNGSRLAEQGLSSGSCSQQKNIGRHHANPVIINRRKRTNQENKIVMGCYLLSEPKIRGCRIRRLSLRIEIEGYCYCSKSLKVSRTGRQNRLFENNQRQFYRELDQEEKSCDDDQPVAEESKQWWENISSQSADHKKDAKWLQDLQK